MAHEIKTGDLITAPYPDKNHEVCLVLSNLEIPSVIAGIPLRLISWTSFLIGRKPVTYEARVGPNTPFELLSRHHD